MMRTVQARLFQYHSRTVILLACVAFAMAVSACSGSEEKKPVSTAIPAAEATTFIAAPPTLGSTATPAPPTLVPAPSATPTPAPPRPSPTPAPPKIEDSVEYKLAVVANGGFVSPNDPIVGRYAGWLDTLSIRCKEPKTRLADMLVAAGQEAEKRRGNSVTIQRITTDLLTITQPGLVVKCDELLASLVVLY